MDPWSVKQIPELPKFVATTVIEAHDPPNRIVGPTPHLTCHMMAAGYLGISVDIESPGKRLQFAYHWHQATP